MPKDSKVCLQCMADTLDCTVEDLHDRIEEYRNEGYALFSQHYVQAQRIYHQK